MVHKWANWMPWDPSQSHWEGRSAKAQTVRGGGQEKKDHQLCVLPFVKEASWGGKSALIWYTRKKYFSTSQWEILICLNDNIDDWISEFEWVGKSQSGKPSRQLRVVGERPQRQRAGPDKLYNLGRARVITCEIIARKWGWLVGIDHTTDCYLVAENGTKRGL